MKYCKDYCGYSCTNGSCPKALYEEYSDRMGEPDDCENCYCFRGCEDCIYPELAEVDETECRKMHGMEVNDGN